MQLYVFLHLLGSYLPANIIIMWQPIRNIAHFNSSLLSGPLSFLLELIFN